MNRDPSLAVVTVGSSLAVVTVGSSLAVVTVGPSLAVVTVGPSLAVVTVDSSLAVVTVGLSLAVVTVGSSLAVVTVGTSLSVVTVGNSLAVVSRGHSLAAVGRPLTSLASLLWSSGSGNRLSSCNPQAPGRRLSSLPLRLSCSVACRVFPGQGSNLCLLHWQVDCLPLSTAGEALLYFLNVLSFLKGQSKYKLYYQPGGTESRW